MKNIFFLTSGNNTDHVVFATVLGRHSSGPRNGDQVEATVSPELDVD
jgi:hypothetical protein